MAPSVRATASHANKRSTSSYDSLNDASSWTLYQAERYAFRGHIHSNTCSIALIQTAGNQPEALGQVIYKLIGPEALIQKPVNACRKF